jgi:preprotein translocase subunit SecG
MSQDTKSQSNMTSAVTGGSGDSFYGKNEGRSKEAKLIKVTKIFTFVFFGITLALNIIPLFVN